MEDTKNVNLYITGFGPFGSVASNPTTEIVKEIDLSSLYELEGYKVDVKVKEVRNIKIITIIKNDIYRLSMWTLIQSIAQLIKYMRQCKSIYMMVAII